MTRTDIDLDDDAVAEVMERHDLASKREAVNFAPNRVRHRPLSAVDISVLRRTGRGDGLELSDLRGEHVPFDE